MYDNVPIVFFPMLWFKQRATITPELARPLRLLLLLRHFGVCLAIAVTFIAFLLIGYAAFLLARLKNNAQSAQWVFFKLLFSILCAYSYFSVNHQSIFHHLSHLSTVLNKFNQCNCENNVIIRVVELCNKACCFCGGKGDCFFDNKYKLCTKYLYCLRGHLTRTAIRIV